MNYFESVEAQLRSATEREYGERSYRRRWWRRRSGAVVAFAVVAAIATPAVAAISSGWSPPGPWHSPDGQLSLPNVKIVPPKGDDTLGILKPATQSDFDALPDSATSAIVNVSMLSTSPPKPPESLAEIQSAVSGIGTTEVPSGDPVSVIAVDDSICLAAASGAANCAPAEDVLKGGTFGATPAGCSQRILGLMPNGVDSLLVDSGADGTIDRAIPVTDNVYEVILPSVRSVLHAPWYSAHPEIKVGLPLGFYGSETTKCHPGGS